MKKFISLNIFLLAFVFATHAQVKAAKETSITIVSANLKCWECKSKLDKVIANENNSSYRNGIIKWTFNLIKGEVRLTYLPDRVTAADIRQLFTKAGFDADDQKADADAYKTLPPICKRAEDGGGQKKGSPPCHVEPQQ